MENIATSSKTISPQQSNTKTFIDPAYLKKGVALPKKGFSFLTVFLCIILASSVWIFLVTIEILPNPYLQDNNISVFVPIIKK